MIEQVKIWAQMADGVTITGGEPFEQCSALTKLVQWLSREFSGDVLVYTGFPIVDVQAVLDEVEGCIDAVISEPFDYRASDKMPLRGSDNQVLHYLTSRGRELYSVYESPSDMSAMDAMFDEDGSVWFCGIPKRQDLGRIQRILRSKGHNVVFTAQTVRGDK